MLIDWFTVVAQALNFLILVWLMKRLLYKPILHAIDAREKRIAAELADADAKKADAQHERDRFRQRNEEFDRQRDVLFGQVTEEARVERQRLLDEARQAADALGLKLRESLRNDANSLNLSISSRTQQEVFAIARKTLADLSGATLEESMVAVFVRRLHALGQGEKELLVSAVTSGRTPVIVRTVFDLPADVRTLVERTLKETLGLERPVSFETAPEIISGIELASDGHKVAWSIADYLTSMEKEIGELLNGNNTPGVTVEVATEDEHGA